MKKIVLAFALSLSLAGCAGNFPAPGGGPISPPSPQGPIANDATVTAIQQAAVKVCGYLPTVQTVADIVTTFTGGGAIVHLVGNVAAAICNAVRPSLSSRKRARVPMVNGIVVRGGFVR